MNTPPAARKTGRGCIIALVISGSLGVLALLVVGIFAYKAATSPEGAKIVSLVSQTKKLMDEATKAPGTKELRKLGCTQAMVLDTERLMALSSSMVPDAAPPPSPEERLTILCEMGALSSKPAPSCDDVKAAYLAAVPSPSGDMLVNVNDQGNSKPRCSKRYTATGAEKP